MNVRERVIELTSRYITQGLQNYSVLQKSVAKSRLLENAIDSRMRIKLISYSDIRQKPCQFYWHGLLHITLVKPVA